MYKKRPCPLICLGLRLFFVLLDDESDTVLVRRLDGRRAPSHHGRAFVVLEANAEGRGLVARPSRGLRRLALHHTPREEHGVAACMSGLGDGFRKTKALTLGPWHALIPFTVRCFVQIPTCLLELRGGYLVVEGLQKKRNGVGSLGARQIGYVEMH